MQPSKLERVIAKFEAQLAEVLKCPVSVTVRLDVGIKALPTVDKVKHLELVETIVCGVFGVKVPQLKGDSVELPLPDARKVVWYICRTRFGYTYAYMGKRHKKHHSTVLTGIKKLKGYMETEPDLKAKFEECINQLEQLEKQ
jgi:chromosomal replication initiation ATPase DnaA